MNLSACSENGTTHPLSGLERWPKSGPIYGFAEQEQEQPKAKMSFWQRLGERLNRPPPGDRPEYPQARVWY
jgi:hypothetical protein